MFNISETIQARHVVTESDMWPIELCHLQ